jgi:CHASE3 domain sensor protein
VQGPLGLIMLGLTALVTVLFLAFVVYLQTSVLIDSRRHARELKAQRALADEAETSRFTELRGFLEEALQKLEGQCEESRTTALTRLDQLERKLQSAVAQAENTLAAYIGELEDRLEGETGGRTPSGST